MSEIKNIIILGMGAIGTAFGNTLSVKDNLNVTLVGIEDDIAESISSTHINHKYFAGIRLNDRLKASSDFNLISTADVIVIAIPSIAVMSHLREIKKHIPKKAIMINLAKGFGDELQTIPQSINEEFDNIVIPMKGPSFAREIINNSPTAFTIACTDTKLLSKLEDLFKGTSIITDKTEDVLGVEYLSILKNIYAIVIGIVDAQFDSANMRFCVFTKAFNEMRAIMIELGGKKKTLFNYCGIGDFGLTSLNDLSRNRTLGLFIGKGFFDEVISNKVVLEGQIAMNNMLVKLKQDGINPEIYPLLTSLSKVFSKEISVLDFVNKIINL
ncbi:MAG: 2-dehydropantoate 2-reductase N-terminal domain-containing protein [Lentimicrobiaceae bacterium]|nr:2-dehydropantoate 2-reductase N-terminal domain-containing protein [Lentimicrobiaceae bacterium]